MTFAGNAVLVVAGTVVLDPDASPLRPGGVLVADGVVVAAGPPAELQGGLGSSQLIDLGELTIVPGLVDAHVHLCFGQPASGDPSSAEEADERTVAVMAEHARELVEAGVTTARDLGSPRDLGVRVRHMLERGLAVGPRLLVANAPLTIPGGHAWRLGGACDDVDALLRLVHERHEQGADLVKMMVTGGGTTPGSDPASTQFALSEIEAVVEEAAALGLPVAAHTHGREGIGFALDAGVSTIEHATWMGPGKAIGAGWDQQLVAELALRGTPVCPTASALWDGMTPARREAKVETVRRMHRAGVRLIAGTDAGVNGVAHANYARGLEALHECGLSAREVLGTATKAAATALGVGDETGTLEAGKAADMIAVQGNPLEDVSALRAVKWVMCRGHVIRGVSRRDS